MKDSGAVLVGREREIEELLSGLDGAESGRGKLFIIEGEPGVGKTRLAEELAVRSRERLALVLWSRCGDGSAKQPHWPWAQIIRSCLQRSVLGEDFYSQIESALADISHVLPGACEPVLDKRPSPISGDPEEVRFRFFEAVRALLKIASEVKPLVLVLDDLGAADTPSLLLLKFLARELHDSRILVVATCRDSEVRSSPALAAVVGDMAREASIIKLRGLSCEEVGLLVDGQIEPTPGITGALHRASGGNPFFVQAILKSTPLELLAQIGQGSVPERFKFAGALGAAIKGHLAPLSAEARRILTVAAVIGREFDANVLARVVAASREELLDILAQAEGAALLVETTQAGAAGLQYRFVHSLVADSLYEDIQREQRQWLHNLIAEALEELYAEDLESHLTSLAYHFFEGAPVGSPARALKYAQRAAERATELTVFEEAVRCYQMALAAMRIAGRSDPRHRCELLLAMGEAQNRSGDYCGARDTFRQASELAGQIRDDTLLARAALGYPGSQWEGAPAANGEAVRLLEHALKTLPDRDDPWRAALLARLASELYYHPAASARREELATLAVEMARRTGDKHALLAILGHRDLVLSGPDLLEERFRNAEAITQVAEETESYLGLYMGFLSRSIYFRHLGDLAKARAETEAMTLLAETTRMPVCLWGAKCFAALRAVLEGRFEEGERLARECLRFAERMRGSEAADLFWPAMIAPFRECNRLDEIAPLALKSVEQRPAFPAHRALTALIRFELGQAYMARAEFEALAANRFADIPHDNAFLACATALAELCAALGDQQRAGELLALLDPYQDLNAVFGPLSSYGAVARYLGLLASTVSRLSEAETYFEKALAVNHRNEARTYVAYTQVDYAAMLLKRGSRRDLSKALELLSQADEAVKVLGMRALDERAETLRQQAQKAQGKNQAEDSARNGIAREAALPVVAHAFPPQRNGLDAPRAATGETQAYGNGAAAGNLVTAFEFLDYANGEPLDNAHAIIRREGDYWTLCYKGRVLRLKHVKGLACLAYLLSHAATDVHSLRLAVAMDRCPEGADYAGVMAEGAGDNWLGDSGPMLDRQARADYKKRLADLREEFEEALQMSDFVRAARVEEEIDFISAEVSRAVGLGGRDRRAASPAERARLNVTKAIKAVLAKIAQHDRDLGAHLAATIRTGTFCSYNPDPHSPIAWKLG